MVLLLKLEWDVVSLVEMLVEMFVEMFVEVLVGMLGGARRHAHTRMCCEL